MIEIVIVVPLPTAKARRIIIDSRNQLLIIGHLVVTQITETGGIDWSETKDSTVLINRGTETGVEAGVYQMTLIRTEIVASRKTKMEDIALGVDQEVDVTAAPGVQEAIIGVMEPHILRIISLSPPLLVELLVKGRFHDQHQKIYWMGIGKGITTGGIRVEGEYGIHKT